MDVYDLWGPGIEPMVDVDEWAPGFGPMDVDEV